MVAIAIRDIGLKPSEFFDMELREYILYSEGFFIRRDAESADLRRIWVLLHDINVKREDQIGNSLEKINSVWPLRIDKVKEVKKLTEEDMLAKFRELQPL